MPYSLQMFAEGRGGMGVSAAMLPSVAVFLSGAAIGIVNYGGLWFTVRRLSSVTRPSLLGVVSFLLRMSLVLGALFITTQGRPIPVTAFLLGLFSMRFLFMRLLGQVSRVRTSS